MNDLEKRLRDVDRDLHAFSVFLICIPIAFVLLAFIGAFARAIR